MTRDEKEAVRKACLEVARAAHEDALTRGLCAEGALEAALGAIETLDLDSIDMTSTNTIPDKETD